MKTTYLTLIIILAFTLILAPLLALNTAKNVSGIGQEFLVFDSKSAKVKAVKVQNYLLNVCLNNLNKDTSLEAIKAEAIAAYTYALYLKEQNKNSSFDFNDIDDGFVEDTLLKEKHKENYAAIKARFLKAVKSVIGQKILYKNKPIMALRHNVSSGFSETAKDILNKNLPYLIKVESSGDILASNYLTEKKVSLKDFKTKAANLNITLSGKEQDYIKITNKTASSGVKSVKIMDKTFSGEEIKNIFNLPSICFETAYNNGNFIFSCKGEGSLLGLSRFGANYMAEQGLKYTEILSWYYPNCSLEK